MYALEQGFLESSRRSCKKAIHLDKFVHRRSQFLSAYVRLQNETKVREQTLKAEEIMHWPFSLFALTELSDMMTKTATMATAKCCQSERGLSNMIFAFGARKNVCDAKERN